MKKTVMAMLVALSIGTVQAASFIWGTGGSGTPIQSSTEGIGLATGSAVLLIYAPEGISFGGNPGALTLGSGMTILDTRAIGANAGRTGNFSYSSESINWGDTLTGYYIVAFDTADWTDATEFAYATYTFTLPASSSATAVNSNKLLLGTSTAYLENIAYNEWTAVPEPTSMALLAFGVAALGLRRKFRA